MIIAVQTVPTQGVRRFASVFSLFRRGTGRYGEFGGDCGEAPMRQRSAAPLAIYVTLLTASHGSAGISAFWFPVASGDGSLGATYPSAAVTGPNGDPQLLGMQTWDLPSSPTATGPSPACAHAAEQPLLQPRPRWQREPEPRAHRSVARARVRHVHHRAERRRFREVPCPSSAASPRANRSAWRAARSPFAGATSSTTRRVCTQIARLTYPLGTAPAFHPQSFTSQVMPDSTVTAPEFRFAENVRWLPDADGSWHDSGQLDARPPAARRRHRHDRRRRFDRPHGHAQSGHDPPGRRDDPRTPALRRRHLTVAATQHSLRDAERHERADARRRHSHAERPVVGSPVTGSPAGGRLESCSLQGGLIVAAAPTLTWPGCDSRATAAVRRRRGCCASRGRAEAVPVRSNSAAATSCSGRRRRHAA